MPPPSRAQFSRRTAKAPSSPYLSEVQLILRTTRTHTVSASRYVPISRFPHSLTAHSCTSPPHNLIKQVGQWAQAQFLDGVDFDLENLAQGFTAGGMSDSQMVTWIASLTQGTRDQMGTYTPLLLRLRQVIILSSFASILC